MKSTTATHLLLLWGMVLTSTGLFCQTDTLIFSEIANGNIIGEHKKWQVSENTYQESITINDRGRGDSIVVVYKENTNGFMTELKVTGHDYYKNPVEETFSLKNGIARWKNSSENAEVKVEGDAFYVSLNQGGGNILTALRKSDKKINLLPSGQLESEIIQEYTVDHHGEKKKLFLYVLKGFGMSPIYGWMDEDHEHFANVSNWYTSIRKGYENFREELLAVQNMEEEKFFYDLPKKSVSSPSTILITNVSLFDAPKATLRSNMQVLIKNGIIAEVSEAPIKVSDEATILTGDGLVLLPGLIDMHVHLDDNLSGLQHIVNGVTSVRDLGNSFAILDLKKKFDNGQIIGPTYESMAGLIDGKGEYSGPTPALAGSAEEAVAWVDTFALKGYSQIKIYSSVHPDWVPAIIQRAKEKGMRVSGHIPAFMTAEEAIQDGYHEIQHLNMLFLNFYGDTIDTRTPLRFTIPAKRAAGFDFESAEWKEFITLLKEKQIVIDPTLNFFEERFTTRPGKVAEIYKPYYQRLPIVYQRFYKSGASGLPVPEGFDSIYIESFAAFLKMTKLLYDSGIQLVAGTDSAPGFAMHRELELLVKAGIPPAEVLKIATIQAAKILNKEAEIGSIEKGKRANLVLVAGNPVDQISDIRKIQLVIKDGKIYDTASLLDAVSIKNYDFVEK